MSRSSTFLRVTRTSQWREVLDNKEWVFLGGGERQCLPEVSTGSVVLLALRADEAWTQQQASPAPGLGQGGDPEPMGCYEEPGCTGRLPVPVAHSSLLW